MSCVGKMMYIEHSLFVTVGSHPHNDPDLMGAWAYLINGYKMWVIFPQGR